MVGCMFYCRDIEKSTVPMYSVKAHNEIINTLDCVGGLGIGEGAPEIVTGSRDGTIKVLAHGISFLLRTLCSHPDCTAHIRTGSGCE